jgi:hypothetical protein
MRVMILGGPHDGSPTQVPTDIGEGQKFLVDGIEYFFNKPKTKPGRLIYYSVSRE